MGWNAPEHYRLKWHISTLSLNRSNLSRALSPEPANESARVYSGGSSSSPPWIGYSFHIIYFWNYADPVAYHIATSLSLSSCHDGVRSRSPVTLNQGSFAEPGELIWAPSSLSLHVAWWGCAGCCKCTVRSSIWSRETSNSLIKGLNWLLFYSGKLLRMPPRMPYTTVLATGFSNC